MTDLLYPEDGRGYLDNDYSDDCDCDHGIRWLVQDGMVMAYPCEDCCQLADDMAEYEWLEAHDELWRDHMDEWRAQNYPGL